MKKESLVIVDQHATVNSYLSLVLPARHALEVEWVGSNLCCLTICCVKYFQKHFTHEINFQQKQQYGLLALGYQDPFCDWGEVVTR